MHRATVTTTRRKRTAVPHLWCENPYAMAATAYLDKGWQGPIPLPPKKKEEPPTGWTGGKNDWARMTPAAVERFKKIQPDGSNIGLWLAPGVIGIDVDHYDKKSKKTGRIVRARGADDLDTLEAELGALPDTVASSARADGKSRIMYFRCPEDMFIGGKLSNAIELIHNGYRYAIVPPSWNPSVEEYYRWYLPGELPDGQGSFEVPGFELIPELPPAWVDYIGKGKNRTYIKEKRLAGSVAATRKVVDDWISNQAGIPCSAMMRVTRAFARDVEDHNIHDRLKDSLWQLMCFSQEGHPGLADSVKALWAPFEAELTRDDSPHGDHGGYDEIAGEFERALDGGAKKILTLIDEDHFEAWPDDCSCPVLDAHGDPQHEININSYKLSEELEPCYRAVAADGEGVYLSSDVVTLYRDGRLDALDRDAFRVELDSSVFCYRNTKPDGPNGPTVKSPVAPSDNLCNALLKSPQRFKALPVLDRFARTPYYARQGKDVVLVKDYGYHPEHRVYLDVDEAMVDTMTKVTGDHAERALAILEGELLVDFPFVEAADRTAILAALLLPFVRELIDGPTPLHFVDAPGPRTGKSLLTDVISIVALGPELEGKAKMAPPTDAREWGKKLFAALLELPVVLILDNVPVRLASSDLAAQLTAYPTLSERVLGKSMMGRPVNKALWLGTGNNVQASDEIARRIVPCRLDAGVESPHTRKGFVNPDLLGYVAENRQKLVWACLELVQNWVEGGCVGGSVVLGGFESWARVIGGILEAAGVNTLLRNQTRFLLAAEDETEGIVEFVRSWSAMFGTGRDNGVLAKDLLAIPDVDDLVEFRGSQRGMALGKYLTKYRDRVVMECKISSRIKGGMTVWYLDRLDGQKADHVKTRRRRV